MNNDNIHSLRQLLNIIPIFAFVAFAGCASTPEDEEEVVFEPATEAPAAAVATPAPSVAATAPAEPIILVPSYPERYVVVKGDTLWDISGRFLRDPWRWPEVWQGNPQVANPHLIFPGDVLMISMVDGRPVMPLAQGDSEIRALGVVWPHVAQYHTPPLSRWRLCHNEQITKFVILNEVKNLMLSMD